MLRRPLVHFLLLALTLIGSAHAASPLDNPRLHGMVRVADGIWMEAAAGAQTPQGLERLVREARQRVIHHYGDLSGSANVVFCATDSCYRRFGAHGLGFSDGQHVLIAPQGRRVAIVAHELAHVELANRLGGMDAVMRAVPQWFDEGLAVVISGAEEFNEATWRAATDGGRHAPSLTELADLDSWNRMTGRDGAGMHLTYGTACHEVRRWLLSTGTHGIRAMLAALGAHEPFTSAYRRIEADAVMQTATSFPRSPRWRSASAADGLLPPHPLPDVVRQP